MVRRKRDKKRGQKSRLRKILFWGAAALAILLAQPAYHLFQIRSAQDRFDMNKIVDERTWVQENAPWLEKVPLVGDSFLWLALNQGEPVNDQELLEHADDKHRLWLLQLKLQQEQLTEETQILSAISSSSMQLLGQGLIESSQGDYDAALEKLTSIPDAKLSKDEKVLKSSALSRCFLGKDDETGAKKESEKARALNPNHPLVIEEEFDLALMDADWEEAERLSNQMEQWPGNKRNLNFQTKKALLFLTLGQTTQWDKVLEELSQSSKGESYQKYLLGIKKYQEGEWKDSQTMLREALTGELSSAVHSDANQALKQVTARIDANKALEKY